MKIYILVFISVIAVDMIFSKFKLHENPIEFYCSNRDSLCREIVKAIDKSKNTLFIGSMTFSDIHVLKAIVKAEKRGVRVVLITDSMMNKSYYRFIEDTTIHVYCLHPKNGIFHQKILVADNVCIIGSANFSRNSLHKDLNDFVVLRSLKIAKSIIYFYTTALTGKIEPVFIHEYIDGVQVDVMLSFRNEKEAEAFWLESFNQGKNARMIYYSFANKDLYSKIEGTPSVAANYQRYNLCNKNILNKKKGRKIHNKMSYNNDFIITGSLNFSKNAFSKNVESIIVIKPNIFFKKCEQFFQEAPFL